MLLNSYVDDIFLRHYTDLTQECSSCFSKSLIISMLVAVVVVVGTQLEARDE